MERFLGFVKQIRRSRRRKGKKYRPEEDYHEGYEDVYYYASEHLHRKWSEWEEKGERLAVVVLRSHETVAWGAAERKQIPRLSFWGGCVTWLDDFL